MAGEDVLAKGLGVELLGLDVVTGETLLGVGDVETTVGGTLHGTENTGASAGPGKTNIKVALERTGVILAIKLFSEGEGAVGLCDTLVLVGKTKFGQGTTGAKEAGCISLRVPG